MIVLVRAVLCLARRRCSMWCTGSYYSLHTIQYSRKRFEDNPDTSTVIISVIAIISAVSFLVSISPNFRGHCPERCTVGRVGMSVTIVM